MFRRGKSEARRRERDGLVSSILLQRGDVPGDRLAITWVDVAPGSRQSPHRHGPEQVYVIIKGKGLMRVGDEEQEVSAGDLVWIPPDAPHGIENRSSNVLSYISASAPAFDLEALYDTGELRAEPRRSD